MFHPRWQLQRLIWRHGCNDPHGCGDRLHRFEPCPKECVRHASVCPERKNGGLVFPRPKTKKSRNSVPIPPPFIPFLREHKAQQEAQRAAAGAAWEEHGAVFTRLDGRPLDPRADWEEFKALLTEAGIDDRRLYDGSRHTAGTILNELGVDVVTIMEILRHIQISRTRRYVKGRSHLSKDAMRRMGDTFMPGPPPAPEPASETTTETTTETADSRAGPRPAPSPHPVKAKAPGHGE